MGIICQVINCNHKISKKAETVDNEYEILTFQILYQKFGFTQAGGAGIF